MIITQTPVRISFFGGGSDFARHFETHGGAVLATAIRRFAYVTVQAFHHEFFDHRLRISYRRTETPGSAAQVEHPAVRTCLTKLGIDAGIELHYMADLPARTGLGSSSSFVVALLQALHAHLGRFRSARDLAEEAIEVERYLLKEVGGWQDQIIAAYGGTCLIRFSASDRFTVTQLPLPHERTLDLERHMLLLYTGIERDSYAVLERQLARGAQNAGTLRRMSDMAEAGAEMLAGETPMTRFGELLHESWLLKRSLSDVSLPGIDAAYEIARGEGASGGKLLGAGQGGFLLLLARPELHERICGVLPGMIPLRVRVNAPGSRVIFAQSDT